MGLPATYWKITIVFTNDTGGSRANCVLWYDKTAGSGATLANAATYANAFKTAYSAALGNWLPDQCSVQKVTFKQVTGGTEVEADNTNGAIAGTRGAIDCLPEEDVACIQRRTGLQGRSKRGRIFLPYISEDLQADGEFNGTGLPLLLAVATMIKSNVAAGGATFEPRTVDWKNSQLVQVVQAGINRQVCSRRDRRTPKRLEVDHV